MALAGDVFTEVRAPRARIRVPAGGNAGQAYAIIAGQSDNSIATTNQFPCKEWSITDDMMTLADAASVVIANVNGENADKFYIGQRIEIDESDPDVAHGAWVRHFTGRVTAVNPGSDKGGGSTINISAMDLGWHLTSCHAPPLKNIKGIKFGKLLDILIDPSWGIQSITDNAIRNTRLKHARQVIVQNYKPVLGAILPYIQVEPGQAPFDILRTYAQREGFLINVGARGELIFFRPQYDMDPLYNFVYRSSNDPARNTNNLLGRPTLRVSLDEVYSEVQCWSTVFIPPEIQNTENPNEAYRYTSYKPPTNPLPFYRLHVFSDPEAITEKMRRNRAIWKYQMGLFNSWQYDIEVKGHSQGGAFFVSNTMASVQDDINGVPAGAYYVQRVQRSFDKDGIKSKLTIRRPGLLDPELDAFRVGAGARAAAKIPEARA